MKINGVELNMDDYIYTLYDKLNLPKTYPLYFRDTCLKLNKKVKYYFPYYIPKIYLYKKPLNIIKTDITSVGDKSYIILLILIYLMFIIFSIVLLK